MFTLGYERESESEREKERDKLTEALPENG
jgi:hypothetical protein